MIIYGFSVPLALIVIRHVKLGKYCSCEKFDKLVLTYEDGILNTTETSLGNKIVI